MSNKIFQLICFLIFVNGFGQKSKYLFEDTISIKKESLEITVESIKPNIKKYVGLFNYSGLETIVFKIKGEKWYMKVDNKWHLFFNNGKKINLVLSTGKLRFATSWMKTNLRFKNNREIFEFKLEPINFSMSGNTKYYFNSTEGFIAIKSHEGFFIRNDVQR